MMGRKRHPRRGKLENMSEPRISTCRIVGAATRRQPEVFVWTTKASDILEKIKRARTALDNR
jgi:hypothetical protein